MAASMGSQVLMLGGRKVEDDVATAVSPPLIPTHNLMSFQLQEVQNQSGYTKLMLVPSQATPESQEVLMVKPIEEPMGTTWVEETAGQFPGLYLSDVEEGSAAWRCGVQVHVGQRLIALNDTEVYCVQDVLTMRNTGMDYNHGTQRLCLRFAMHPPLTHLVDRYVQQHPVPETEVLPAFSPRTEQMLADYRVHPDDVKIVKRAGEVLGCVLDRLHLMLVNPNSPAAAHNLQRFLGHRLSHVNGRPVMDMEDIASITEGSCVYVRWAPPGEGAVALPPPEIPSSPQAAVTPPTQMLSHPAHTSFTTDNPPPPPPSNPGTWFASGAPPDVPSITISLPTKAGSVYSVQGTAPGGRTQHVDPGTSLGKASHHPHQSGRMSVPFESPSKGTTTPTQPSAVAVHNRLSPIRSPTHARSAAPPLAPTHKSTAATQHGFGFEQHVTPPRSPPSMGQLPQPMHSSPMTTATIPTASQIAGTMAMSQPMTMQAASQMPESMTQQMPVMTQRQMTLPAASQMPMMSQAPMAMPAAPQMQGGKMVTPTQGSQMPMMPQQVPMMSQAPMTMPVASQMRGTMTASQMPTQQGSQMHMVSQVPMTMPPASQTPPTSFMMNQTASQLPMSQSMSAQQASQMPAASQAMMPLAAMPPASQMQAVSQVPMTMPPASQMPNAGTMSNAGATAWPQSYSQAAPQRPASVGEPVMGSFILPQVPSKRPTQQSKRSGMLPPRDERVVSIISAPNNTRIVCDEGGATPRPSVLPREGALSLPVSQAVTQQPSFMARSVQPTQSAFPSMVDLPQQMSQVSSEDETMNTTLGMGLADRAQTVPLDGPAAAMAATEMRIEGIDSVVSGNSWSQGRSMPPARKNASAPATPLQSVQSPAGTTFSTVTKAGHGQVPSAQSQSHGVAADTIIGTVTSAGSVGPAAPTSVHAPAISPKRPQGAAQAQAQAQFAAAQHGATAVTLASTAAPHAGSAAPAGVGSGAITPIRAGSGAGLPRGASFGGAANTPACTPLSPGKSSAFPPAPGATAAQRLCNALNAGDLTGVCQCFGPGSILKHYSQPTNAVTTLRGGNIEPYFARLLGVLTHECTTSVAQETTLDDGSTEALLLLSVTAEGLGQAPVQLGAVTVLMQGGRVVRYHASVNFPM